MDKQYSEIIGIGAAVYDTLMVVDGYPKEDTKQQSLETKVQGGGPCATALVAARKLGVSAAYLGTLGKDPFGDFLLEDLKHWGVDTSYVRRVPDGVSFHSVVLLNRAGGSRTCVWNKGTVEEPAEGDVDTDLLRQAKVLHLDGHMGKAALYAAGLCRGFGVKVSLDADGIYPETEKLLPLVDYLVPSERFALRFTGAETPEQAARELYEKYRPELLAVTQGDRGGILMDEQGMRRYACYPVEVVDSNGCGDTFHGALIAGKIRGLNNDAACRYASAAAAIKCMRLGARYAMADDAECREFLRERGEPLE